MIGSKTQNSKPVVRVAFIVLAALGLSIQPAQPIFAQDKGSKRPIIVTKEQYRCLVGYADRLRVSKKGTVFYIGKCPPESRSGMFGVAPGDRDMILLKPQDIKCLLKARKKGHGMAYMKSSKSVALYLRPCGRN